MENLGSFARHTPWWSLAFLVVVALTGASAWRLQRQRDIGCARWTRLDRVRAHVWLLKTPWRFSWRERRSTLVAWAIGLAAVGLIVGYLTNALVVFARADPAYVRLLDRLGLGVMVSAKGFVGEVCFMMTLALCFLVITLLVMLASDDQRGRLDLPLSYGTGRLTWMGSAVLSTAMGTVLVALICGVSIWLGVESSGTSMALWVPLAGMLNAASPAPLLIGITLLIVTLVARFAYMVVAALLALTYLVALLGPVLHWPHWLLRGSPFFYLRLVPAQPANWGAMLACTAIGLVAGAGAFYRFSTRDVGR
jgi:ABC-2 type transport system permease protein